MSDFSGTEACCTKMWEVTLFTGDTNSNLVMDYPSEFTSPLPTSSVSGGLLFSKTSNLDNLFEVNVLKTLVNADSNFYYLRARLHFDSTATSEDFSITELKILPDCSIESITASSISNILYTFNQAASALTLPPFTSSHPTNCSVEYTLTYKNPATSIYGAITPVTAFVTWINTTQSLSVEYHVDNRFSSLNTDNIYEMRLTGCLWGGVCSSADFNIVLTKDCQYASMTGNSLDITTSLINYVAGNPAIILVYTKPSITDQYCSVGYEILVHDNITVSTQDYVTKFGADPSTAATHSDGVSRTESYLLQNKSSPAAAGTHELAIFTTTSVFNDLNAFSKDITGDHFLYTITLRTFVLPTELSGGSRDSVDTLFNLIVQPWCHGLILVPPALLDIEYGVWDPTKTQVFDEF